MSWRSRTSLIALLPECRAYVGVDIVLLPGLLWISARSTSLVPAGPHNEARLLWSLNPAVLVPCVSGGVVHPLPPQSCSLPPLVFPLQENRAPATMTCIRGWREAPAARTRILGLGC